MTTNPPSSRPEDEGERYRRDRERLDRDFDPYTDGFNIYRVNPRRQEAYDKCAPQVVSFLKCVDKEGPTWFWRCNALHIELQQCYNAAKPPSPSLITTYAKEFRDTALLRWDQLKWFIDSLTGGSKGE